VISGTLGHHRSTLMVEFWLARYDFPVICSIIYSQAEIIVDLQADSQQNCNSQEETEQEQQECCAGISTAAYTVQRS